MWSRILPTGLLELFALTARLLIIFPLCVEASWSSIWDGALKWRVTSCGWPQPQCVCLQGHLIFKLHLWVFSRWRRCLNPCWNKNNGRPWRTCSADLLICRKTGREGLREKPLRSQIRNQKDQIARQGCASVAWVVQALANYGLGAMSGLFDFSSLNAEH